MDDSIYQEKVSPILTELTNIAAKLVQVYKNKLEKNLNIINAYIMSPDFNLIARDGSQIKVQNTFYIELSPQSGVFLDSTEGKIIV
ncbi:hypothetical protein J3T00_08625, partial [Staphylococcus aureus]|uniref:hypothetical protein n=3 Tax=Bacilli TaxID=91061 RepID=UPI0022FEE4AD